MKKMISVMAVGALVLGSMAMAMTRSAGETIDQSQVDAKIDARLRDLLVAARNGHANR